MSLTPVPASTLPTSKLALARPRRPERRPRRRAGSTSGSSIEGMPGIVAVEATDAVLEGASPPLA
nr:hypothetical protein [Methylorubrum aminovorans]